MRRRLIQGAEGDPPWGATLRPFADAPQHHPYAPASRTVTLGRQYLPGGEPYGSREPVINIPDKTNQLRPMDYARFPK